MTEKKQKTRPKKGKPMEIPVPKRRDVLRDLDKLTRPEKRTALRRTSTNK